MSRIRFLLDENVPVLFRKALLRREPTMPVWKVGDVAAPPKETPDPELLTWCEKNSYILVTNNRHSMPIHLRAHLAQGRHVPGILVLNENMSIGATVDELWLIWAAAKGDEFRDQITYLPIR